MCSRSECSVSGWLIALIQNQRFQSVPFLAHLLPAQPNLKRRGATSAASANVGVAPVWSISKWDHDVGGSGGGNASVVPDAFLAHLLLLPVPKQLPPLSPDRRRSSTSPRVAPDSGFPGQAALTEARTLVQRKGFSPCPVTCV